MDFPKSKYNVVLADPPWSYGKKKHRGGNPNSHYPTMTNKQIIDLPVESISEDTSCLFLWVTNPKIKLGFEVMEAWGFKYQTIISWIKTQKNGDPINNGMGFYFRGATEHILFGTKGKFKIPSEKRIPNVIHSQRSFHSRKPIAQYQIIDKVCDGRKIELFARTYISGWDSWGNQLSKDLFNP